MSIKEIKSGTLYKEYVLEIPYEEINKIIDSKINELLPTVSIPGFRKGKAPINIVELTKLEKAQKQKSSVG